MERQGLILWLRLLEFGVSFPGAGLAGMEECTHGLVAVSFLVIAEANLASGAAAGLKGLSGMRSSNFEVVLDLEEMIYSENIQGDWGCVLAGDGNGHRTQRPPGVRLGVPAI